MFNYHNVKHSKFKSITFMAIQCIIILTIFLYFAQTFFAHRYGNFMPEYSKIEINHILNKNNLQTQDYETLLLQTGLGRSAIDYLIENDDSYKETIRQYQKYFFDSKHLKCDSLLGIFTREDILINNESQEIQIPFIAIQPGDVIVTTSTHSAGWRHGHSALFLGKGRTLESTVWGSNSVVTKLSDWQRYSNFAILRVKNSSNEYRLKVAEYAYNNLVDIPYRLTCGLWGEKAKMINSPTFGLQCGYLVWYAWQANGVDLDSDGGKLVTPNDILQSQQLEVVQLFGMDPKEFLN